MAKQGPSHTKFHVRLLKSVFRARPAVKTKECKQNLEQIQPRYVYYETLMFFGNANYQGLLAIT